MNNSVSNVNAVQPKNIFEHGKSGLFAEFNQFSESINTKNKKPEKDKFETAKKNLEAAKKHNGLIEKTADFIKNKTGFGISIKSIEKDINSGRKTENEINNDIKNYRRAQENTAQGAADILSCTAAILSFFKIKNSTELLSAKIL